MAGIRVIAKATDRIAKFREAKKNTLSYYQNELGASEIHALFFQPAR